MKNIFKKLFKKEKTVKEILENGTEEEKEMVRNSFKDINININEITKKFKNNTKLIQFNNKSLNNNNQIYTPIPLHTPASTPPMKVEVTNSENWKSILISVGATIGAAIISSIIILIFS